MKELSIRQNTFWNTLGCLFYLTCQWLITVLVATLSADFTNAGNLAYAMVIGNIFITIALFKVRVYQVSDIKNCYSSANYIAFRLLSIFFAALVVVLYLYATTNVSAYLSTSLAYLLFKADESFSDVLYGIVQKNKRMDYIGISQFLRGILSLGSFCFCLYFLNSLIIALFVMFFVCLLVTVLYDLPKAKQYGSVFPKITKTVAWGIAKSCFPIMLTSLFIVAIVSLTRQYFGLTHGDVELGIYATIATPAVVLQASLSYLYAPMLVTAAERYASGDKHGLLLLLLKTTLTLLFFMILIGVPFALVGPWFLPTVFGTAISPYVYIFPFVLLGTGSVGVFWFVADILAIIRQYKWLVASGIAGIGCCFTLVVLFIDLFYMNGINFVIIVSCLGGTLVGSIGLLFNVTRKNLSKDKCNRNMP